MLGEEGDLPAVLAALERTVETLLNESDASMVTVESDTGRGTGSTILRAHHAVAVIVAGRRSLWVVRKLNPAIGRKHTLGCDGYDGCDVDRLYALASGILDL